MDDTMLYVDYWAPPVRYSNCMNDIVTYSSRKGDYKENSN